MQRMRTTIIAAVVLGALFAVSRATPAHACGMVIQPGGWYKYVCEPLNPPGPGGRGSAPSARYGAIAYSPASGLYGYSDNYPNRAQADQRALRECGQADCVVASWFWNQCGALAAGDNGTWGAEAGSSEARAQSLALARCDREGGNNCQIKISHCAGG